MHIFVAVLVMRVSGEDFFRVELLGGGVREDPPKGGYGRRIPLRDNRGVQARGTDRELHGEV